MIRLQTSTLGFQAAQRSARYQHQQSWLTVHTCHAAGTLQQGGVIATSLARKPGSSKRFDRHSSPAGAIMQCIVEQLVPSGSPDSRLHAMPPAPIQTEYYMLTWGPYVMRKSESMPVSTPSVLMTRLFSSVVTLPQL
jgi:hypothetical protein